MIRSLSAPSHVSNFPLFLIFLCIKTWFSVPKIPRKIDSLRSRGNPPPEPTPRRFGRTALPHMWVSIFLFFWFFSVSCLFNKPQIEFHANLFFERAFENEEVLLNVFQEKCCIGRALARISEMGVQKYTFGVNWVSNPFSSHCIIHKNMDIRVSKIGKPLRQYVLYQSYWLGLCCHEWLSIAIH